MPEVVIPPGGPRDGWIVISVNGELQWIKTGEPTDLSTSEVEVLDHAGISYALPSGDNPFVLADFKNGVYQVDGVSLTINDVLEENLDVGSWDPSKVVPGVGLDPDGTFQHPCLKTGTLPITLGCTIIVKVANAFGSLTVQILDTPGYNNQYTALVQGSHLELNDGGIAATDDDPGGEHLKAALNMGMERIAGSLGGRAVVGKNTYNNGEPDPVPFNTSNLIAISPGIVESVAWYPLQDEADLPMLSTI